MRKVNEIVSAGIAEKLSLTGGDGFHMHPPADETRNGFMTVEDRILLNGRTSSATPNTLMLRDSTGQSKVGTPTSSDHIARKSDVDQLSSRVDNIIADGDSSAEVVDARGGYPVLGGRLNAVDAQLADVEQQITEKTNQTDFLFKKSLLYERALHDAYLPVKSLDSAKRAIVNGTLKVAFIGDSITEGSDQVNVNDCYVNKVQKLLTDAFPNTTVTVVNYALSGQSIENFVDPGFVGVASQAAVVDRTKQFYRPWSTVGKSWMQSIKDFQPNILVIAFGMNSSGSATSSNSVGNSLQTIVNNFEKEAYNPSLVVIPTILPSKNPEYTAQSQTTTQSVANVTREVAKVNNLAIADVNRLYRILRDGIDEGLVEYKKFTLSGPGEADCDFYDGVISYSFSGASAGEVLRFDYRLNSGSASLILLIVIGSSTSSFRLFYNAGAGSVLIGQKDGVTLNISVSNTIKLEARGIFHDVYLNGVLVNTFQTNIGTGRGRVTFTAPTASAVLSNITIASRVPAKEYPRYTELELLGAYDDPDASGNGINHPTGLGHSLFFVAPFFKIIDNLKHLPRGLTVTKQITGGWIQSVSTSWGTVTDDGLNIYYKSIGAIDYDPTLLEQYLTNSTGTKYKYNGYASRQGKVHLLKSNEYAYAKDGTNGLMFLVASAAPSDTFTLTINEPY